MESKKRRGANYKIHEIDLDDTNGADVKVKIEDKMETALVDTGASCSCMSEESYKSHSCTPLKALCNINVRSAGGNNLEPLGVATYTFTLGNRHYTQPL